MPRIVPLSWALTAKLIDVISHGTSCPLEQKTEVKLPQHEHSIVNTLRPRQINANFQTTFSNGYYWMKMYEFRSKFHWFLRFQLTIFQHWYRWWLGADLATSHYLYQWWIVYWRIYAPLGLNELKSYHDICIYKPSTIKFYGFEANSPDGKLCNTLAYFVVAVDNVTS